MIRQTEDGTGCLSTLNEVFALSGSHPDASCYRHGSVMCLQHKDIGKRDPLRELTCKARKVVSVCGCIGLTPRSSGSLKGSPAES